jgi:hypothetical protein
MTQVFLGNHSAVRVARAERDRIRRFYRDVLGGTLVRGGVQKDDFRLVGVDEDLSKYEGTQHGDVSG